MKHAAWIVTMAVLGAALAGCAMDGRQPRLENALITPSALKPGDTAVITVEVRDRFNVVDRVEGVILEDPTISLKLKDDGTPPDSLAGDRVWSLRVEVPFQAPPGGFTLQLTAYRADGTPVPVDNKEGQTVPLSASVNVVIEAP